MGPSQRVGASASRWPTRCGELELPDGPGQAWGAAESRVARDVREILRGEREMPRKHVKATGYWLRSGDWLLDD